MKSSYCFLVTFLAASIATTSADAQNAARTLSPAEEWVVKQVMAHEADEVDLSKQFPDEKDRQLSAHFLEDLVIGTLPNVKPNRTGVRIREAVVDEPINLGNAQIPYELWLHHCHFKREVNCQNAAFAGALLFDDSTFDAAANFNGAKVGGSVFTNNAVFEGPVDFVLADIGGSFHALGAKFQNPTAEANFGAMKVRAYGFFNNAVFKGSVNLRYSEFTGLILSDAQWPKVAAQCRMHGVTYKFIRAVEGNESQSHKALLKLADQSAYSADFYSNLEACFARQGYREDADEAFIAGKRRERQENLHGWHWVGSGVLDWLVGYGRRPWRAGIPCVCFVLLGCVLFLPSKMEVQKVEDAKRIYNSFWYSLGLFLPFVNLQSAEVWKPKNSRWFLRHYMRVHILLGWILIPILLAAISGLIK